MGWKDNGSKGVTLCHSAISKQEQKMPKFEELTIEIQSKRYVQIECMDS